MRSVLLTLWVMLALPAGASAQGPGGIAIDLYQAAETSEDGFALSRPIDRGHLRFGALLQADYGLAPLVLTESGAPQPPRLVSHLVGLRASVSLGLIDRVVIYGSLPVVPVMEGDLATGGVPQARGGGISDPTLGARVRLVGEAHEPGALALQLTGSIPLAEALDAGQDLLGEGGATFSPEVLGEVRVAFLTISANVGFLFRTAPTFTNLEVGHELTWGVGVGARFLENLLEVRLESYGRVGITEPSGSTAPTEAILGLRLRPLEGLVIGLAGGPGLGPGYGTPAFRGVLSVGWSDTIDQQRRAASESLDVPEASAGEGGARPASRVSPGESAGSDEGGDETGTPRAPRTEGGPSAPASGEPSGASGSPRERSEAPLRHGSEVGVPHGQVAPSSDATAATQTAASPETARPEYAQLDRDLDRVVDAEDRCPIDREDFDEVQDEDGCPEQDADQDGLVDSEDRCPLTPGRALRGQCNGCPELACVVQGTGAIEITQHIEFEAGAANLLESSEAVLRDVLSILQTNDQIVRLRIEGHTDEVGDDATNLELSVRRSATVVDWLVQRGIERERLTGFGCGEQFPIRRGRSQRTRAHNRRVEFLIVDPPSRREIREGCTAAQ